MKHLFLAFIGVVLTGSIARASGNLPVVTEEPIAPYITTVDEYAFLVIDLGKTEVSPLYGDTVELVFDKNKRVTLFNLSGKEIKFFTDTDGKLIVFVPSEELRCFQNHILKKVVLKDEGKKIVLKTKTPTNYFE